MAEHDDEAMDAARDDDAESSIMAVEKVSAAEVDGAFVGNEENRQNASSAADTAAALPKKNDGPNNNNKEEEPLVAPVAAAAGQSANHNPLKRPVASILNEAGKIDVAADNTNPAASSIPNDADDNVTAKQQQPSPPPPLAPEEPPLPVVVAAAIDITKPVKRARTAYLIFADDKRGEVQEKHPGQPISVIARALGALWSGLSDEAKQPYRAKATAERERVERAVESWKAAGGVVPAPGPIGRTTGAGGGGNRKPSPGGVSLSSVDMPIARVKKICKLDPEVKNLTKEGLVMVTKAAEFFITHLATECVKTAQIQNRRKLLPDDIAQVCSVREQFLFLREDIKDLHRHLQHNNAETARQTKAATAKKGAGGDGTTQGKPITDFFKSAQPASSSSS